MPRLKFITSDGKWISVDIEPENSLDTYYVVTLTHIEYKFNMVSEQYWRYVKDSWQYYNDGKWNSTWNPLFKVTAYQKIIDLEAAPYEKFH